MSAAPAADRWMRRARPLLGTLVEIGVASGPFRPAGQEARCPGGTRAGTDPSHAIAAAFDAIAALQGQLSRFEPDGEPARIAALRPGESLCLREPGARVLRAAWALARASDGGFDPSAGSYRALQLHAGRVTRVATGGPLDLGGIAKGYAVDLAVRTLRAHGVRDGWVNAGGDLRAFGVARLPVALRDERRGGVRVIGTIAEGSFATSRFASGSRCRLFDPRTGDRPDARAPSGARPALDAADARERHVSVAAPRCLWADALTKLVAATGDTAHPLLARLGARAWIHPVGDPPCRVPGLA